MSRANSHQVGGKHYGGGATQHWDYVTRCLDNRYLEGQITKYAARHAEKNRVEDIKKAQHYLEKLREEFIAGRVEARDDWQGWTSPTFEAFTKSMPPEETEVMRLAATWVSTAALDRIGRLLAAIEERYNSVKTRATEQS